MARYDQSDTVGSVPPLIEQLLQRMTGEESLELEWKSAQGGLPKSMWETISAFANTKGGWIVLGIAERDGQLHLEGVKHAAHQLKTLFDLMRSSQRISQPVCGTDDISIESLGEKDVIAIRVPAAQRKVRPIYINGNPYLGTYLRRHEGDYHATKPEVDRMMREASDVGADSAILKRYGLDDLDRDTLARYRRRYQTQHPDWPANAYDDLEFLKALNAYRRDRETGEAGLTVAGLLMFGTIASIREWRTRHLIDYRVVSTESDGDRRWDDRVEWEGNLLGAYEALSPRLVRDQPIPFVMEGGTRQTEGPVHAALREALVNLLVHTDYAESQASLIQRTPEGYTFRNPGSSRVPESDLLTGDRSDPRNPELVRMFRFIGLAEEAGTGIPNIRTTWRKLGLRPPLIDVGTERYEFTIELRHAHLLSDDDLAWLSMLGANWTEAEQLALVCARHEDGIDNLRLRQLTEIHPADATKVLSTLRSRRLLEMVRGGRGAYYRLGPLATAQQGYPRQKFLRGVVPPLASNNAPSLGDSAPSLGDKASSLQDNAPSLRDSASGTSDDEKLRQLSARAHQHQRMAPSERDALIVEMCAVRPLSPQELANLLGRSIEHVRHVLAVLIDEGKLVYQYPTQPQHPQQRYLANVSRSDGAT